MNKSTIEAITDFIFIGKRLEELTNYDLLIINADWAEKELADDMKRMYDKNIINDDTTFIICGSHGNTDRDSADILIKYLNELNFKNKIIIDKKYISNPEILEHINELVDISNYNKILRVAKAFVARRWYMNATKYNFPIDKCDFFGIVDDRKIGRDTWYLSDTGINQVMKEFINIGQQTIDGELRVE